MKKTILILFVLSVFATFANNSDKNDAKDEINLLEHETCEEYAANAAKEEATYYWDWGNYWSIKQEWLDICNDVMGGDPSGWEDPLFCDLSCWPSYYD